MHGAACIQFPTNVEKNIYQFTEFPAILDS